MAEIAIPLMALGGMYVISNQKKSNDEKMKTLANVVPWKAGTIQETSSMPNINSTNVKQYINSNQTTDKYYNNNVSHRVNVNNPLESVGGGVKEQTSLTGEKIDKMNFEHNNMVPFFGARVKGATVSADIGESILDSMQGNGSQYIRKKEQAPLFKPHDNLHHAHGAPNTSDFIQSRVNPSMRMANVKPWEEERVAPGLNQGFNTTGSAAGFNSGMESRNSWLPKTVNQLRVDTNPKMTYGLSGHEGPADSFIKEAGTVATQGKVEKYLPDTYYNVGPERWFTTTGIEKAQTVRSVEMLQDVNRTTTTSEYYGAGKDGEATYARGEFTDAKRPQLAPNDIMAAGAMGKHEPHTGDHGNGSHTVLHNNRSTTQHAKDFGVAHGIVRAIVAPLLDILRPSRKENVIGNLRPNGVANTTVSNLPVYNPADRTRTTIREMTENKLDNNHLNVENQAANAYLVSQHQPVDVQRDTTNTSYVGSAGGPTTNVQSQSYESAYNQRNNVNKIAAGRLNHGNTNSFNNDHNIQISRKDNDRNNNRMWAPSGGPMAIPGIETHGSISVSQCYDNKLDNERINPDILTAFKNNPYTQSLSSW